MGINENFIPDTFAKFPKESLKVNTYQYPDL